VLAKLASPERANHVKLVQQGRRQRFTPKGSILEPFELVSIQKSSQQAAIAAKETQM
jgi:hypothetical protein